MQLVFVVLLVLTSSSRSSTVLQHSGFGEIFYNLLTSTNETIFRELQNDYMRNIRNTEVDPCDDFYEYACGNWANVVNKQNETLSVSSALDQGINFALHKLLSEEMSPEDIIAVREAKTFYKSCTEEVSQDYTELAAFLEVLGPWPLTNDSWNDTEFDWFITTAHAHAFDAEVIFKYWRKDQDRPYKLNYFDVLKESPLQVFWKKQNVSTKDSQIKSLSEVLSLIDINVDGKEEMLAEVHAFEELLMLLRKECDSQKYNEPSAFTMDDFSSNFSDWNFEHYFRILEGSGKLVTWDFAALFNEQCFRDMLDLVQHTNSRVLANDIYINMALHFIMSSKYNKTDIVNQCTILVKYKMTPVALYMFSRRFYDEVTANGVEEIFDEMMEVGRLFISETHWIDGESRSFLLKNFNRIQAEIGFDNELILENRLGSIYNHLALEEDNFMRNLIKIFRHDMIYNQMIPFGSGTMQEPFTFNAFFVPYFFVISVPLAMVQPVVFHKFSPRFANYGGLGTVIGHELAHIFDMDSIKINPDEDESYKLDQNLERVLLSKMECYHLQYNNFKLEQSNNSLTASENIADNLGLALALSAYMNVINSTGGFESDVFSDDSGHMLNSLQAFFLSFAQLWCGETNPDEKDQVFTDEHAPERTRVLGALSNSDEFSQAFNCPDGSYMNPKNKCRF